MLNCRKFLRSGQCCWKLWRVGTPFRPSSVILQGWHLSVGSHVSHRGTVFCCRILTDVSRRFVYAAVRQVLFSSGDQCLSCSLADLMFICWWSITLWTAWGLVLPFPLPQSLCLHYKGQVINRYTGICYCMKLMNVDYLHRKPENALTYQNNSPSF